MKHHVFVEQIINKAGKAHIQLTVEQLIEKALLNKEGYITDNGAFAADTGEFTGRSPKDKFVVMDSETRDVVWWGDVNNKIEPEKFDALLAKILKHLESREVFIRQSYACADDNYRLNIEVVTETAYQNIFANNLFLRPSSADLEEQSPEWLILAVPSFHANPSLDGTRQHNFTMIDFSKKIILIGGSGYTGEIKKGIFTVLNYVLPHHKHVLSMHCSANIGLKNDTAIFFGLSGTGKTTLSADPNRKLIGDDEHGWADQSVFNFEGGCYAKCVDLSQEKEPQIWSAIKHGALVENVRFYEGSNTVDYNNISVTENTRVAYPIDFIENIATPSVGQIPENIFFLTADAFGVLPPISRLTPNQAMYHFISGYTAKVAGTEAGVTEPQATFSACFGKAFLPLHPAKYAEMLGQKLVANPNIKVWLINTGWNGGAYGIGKRMKLDYTRAMITAALEHKFDTIDFVNHNVFGIAFPVNCPHVPSELLNPRNTWVDKMDYDKTASHLADLFNSNFKQYAEGCSPEILSAAPQSQATA